MCMPHSVSCCAVEAAVLPDRQPRLAAAKHRTGSALAAASPAVSELSCCHTRDPLESQPSNLLVQVANRQGKFLAELFNMHHIGSPQCAEHGAPLPSRHLRHRSTAPQPGCALVPAGGHGLGKWPGRLPCTKRWAGRHASWC